VIAFVLTRALPGDPAAYLAGPSASNRAVEEIRQSLGLDRSWLEQFVAYVSQIGRGELGSSWSTGQPVATELAARLPASLELTALGLLFAVGVAVPLGIAAAVKPGSALDHAARFIATAGVSLPTFFTGLLLVYVFYYLLGWFPAPLGRLAPFADAPPAVTGLYLVDSLLAGDLRLWFTSLCYLMLPA